MLGRRSIPPSDARPPLSSESKDAVNSLDPTAIIDQAPSSAMQNAHLSQAQIPDVVLPRTLDDSYQGTIIPETQSSKHSTSHAALSQEISYLDDAIANESDVIGERPPDWHEDVRAKGKATALMPIPVITPSKFRQHLPVSRAITDFMPIMHEDTADTDFSPIKAFESSTSQKKGTQVSETLDDIVDESASLPRTQELQARGLELAAMYSARNRDVAIEKRPLSAILAHRDYRTSLHDDGDVVDDSLAQEMEDAFVDLDGRGGQKQDQHVSFVPSVHEDQIEEADVDSSISVAEDDDLVEEQAGSGDPVSEAQPPPRSTFVCSFNRLRIVYLTRFYRRIQHHHRIL